MGYVAADLYWGVVVGNGRKISTGNDVVGYVAVVDLYLGRCGTVYRCKSLLETLW